MNKTLKIFLVVIVGAVATTAINMAMGINMPKVAGPVAGIVHVAMYMIWGGILFDTIRES
ncbi:MAG: hypothetical protein V1896_00325 [Candidatus Zambryskibacteria bacterium]